MKVKDLVAVTVDNIILYQNKNDGFTDLYKGNYDSIPSGLLDLEIKNIGAKKKSILDVRVD